MRSEATRGMRKVTLTVWAAVLGAAIVPTVGAVTVMPADAAGSNGGEARYLSAAGDDAADGRTPATAWRTVEKLNGELPAGATAYLRCGDVFYGGISVKGGADAAHPTVLTKIGRSAFSPTSRRVRSPI